MAEAESKIKYQTPTFEQREKLEEFFHHITSIAQVDNTNQEIKDIQNAVSIMLERIRTRVNSRGIFNIDRKVLPNKLHSGNGSLVGTVIWNLIFMLY